MSVYLRYGRRVITTSKVDWAGMHLGVFVSIQYFLGEKDKGLCVEIASSVDEKSKVELLSLQFLSPALKISDFPLVAGVPNQIPSRYISTRYQSRQVKPIIDLPLIFKSFSGTILRQALSAHLLARFQHEDRNQAMDIDKNLEQLAARYLALTDWNEASPAKYLALLANEPVERLHTRIKVARRRGLIPSLGKGVRVGKS